MLSLCKDGFEGMGEYETHRREYTREGVISIESRLVGRGGGSFLFYNVVLYCFASSGYECEWFLSDYGLTQHGV
jgi:hypothetical protein